jgi:Asp-tRNA(Asn)/Glu-tRNA(Gln) amidotransferase A subunit family amidase
LADALTGPAPALDPADLELREAVAAVAAGNLSAASLTEACLARAAAVAELGAFVALREQDARREAAALDDELRSGGLRARCTARRSG